MKADNKKILKGSIIAILAVVIAVRLVESIRSLGESDYSLLETMALMFVFLVSLSLLFIWTFGAARKNEKSKH